MRDLDSILSHMAAVSSLAAQVNQPPVLTRLNVNRAAWDHLKSAAPHDADSEEQSQFGDQFMGVPVFCTLPDGPRRVQAVYANGTTKELSL